MSHRTSTLVASGRQHLVPTYRQRELVLERGEGSRLWDIEGREYVDFAAGIAVSALGHGDADILAALAEQAGKLWHTSNIFYSEPPLRLAEELIAASGFAARVFFCNSGAEANEAAIKLARRFAADAGRPPERRSIISFHGETVTQLRREFAAAVKDYLRDCEEQGVAPEKPASGKLLLRVPPDVHSRALVAAQAHGKSLNQWATEALQRAMAEG